ncbi:Hypothetical protein PP7435_CHR1-2390 [Komagataella phaffii CBS 7435]|uniref:Uncharacterized protein n=1 Tax=Komagataella phaffii (strain ATCC 76273 / CBS 7435 / CECT 11047 / NRRL Y-11430 / Wegner 21-1) TaxID=981350 RepID=A0A1G4KPA3_KOMPC|nr:GQ67_02241T0 [Komagataella phaffii]AOA66823.1 GQ68_02255T0 [Komagataella phaffii GS115]CAH2446580.1 Hypothetical protein BQ9382_C1-3740 [Komagataella phaffii CBS 7435]SCV11842.1 Hypothetical protein PP7435_CHR1-2390 [Komagataella phaffii CBS 7435]
MSCLSHLIASVCFLLCIVEAHLSTRFLAFFSKGEETPESKVLSVRETLKGKTGCRIVYEYELTLKGFAFDLDHDDSTLSVLETLRNEFNDNEWPLTIEVDSEIHVY